MALTESGEPAPAFWDLLREKVTAHLTPATIRFGVPPAIRLSQIDYQAAADEFMRLHPDITIELVTLTANPPAPEELVDLDGAALQLTQGLITNGLVYDLTDFALEDADLRSSDFYEQIWLASFWRERMWQIPHMAEMQLLFYDRMAYHTSGHAEPTLRWTWEEMTQDMTAVLATEPSEQMVWGYMDVSRDTLFSYAYNWKNDCTEAATVRCQRRLDDASVTAALAWYQQMVSSEQMPDVTGIAPDEAQQFSMVSQSLRRHSLIWVEDPMQYEHHLLLNAIGVLPFPGSDRFDGITPLRIHGNIITQHSQRPLAVWEWIKFLSYQPPVPRIRLIPARPSVASSTAYWGILPLPLGNAMRTAFPFARPILIEEQPYFPTEQLTAVLNGENPADAAREWPQLNWFTLDD
jgi:ABC-type glycerol-3-phosphate transport system substrate-binding protein